MDQYENQLPIGKKKKTSVRQGTVKKPMTQSERTAQSNARMLEKAIDLIVENGVEHMTLKEVGEAAGYSRGLASFHFGSKKNLIACVIRAVGDEWLLKLKLVTQDQFGVDAICAAIDAHYRFCVAASNHVRAFYILWFESISPGSLCKEIMVGIDRRRKNDTAKWIRQGIERRLIDPAVDADTIAEQFCASILGIVYHWLLNPMAMEEVKNLHEGLKRVMITLLSTESQRVAPASRKRANALE